MRALCSQSARDMKTAYLDDALDVLHGCGLCDPECVKKRGRKASKREPLTDT